MKQKEYTVERYIVEIENLPPEYETTKEIKIDISVQQIKVG